MTHVLLQHARENPSGFLEVAVHDFHAVGAGIRVIDVREPREFDGELGHIAGAELVPLATVAANAAGWSPSEPLLMVCRSGKRSANAVKLLQQLGFTAVINLQGGMKSIRQS